VEEDETKRTKPQHCKKIAVTDPVGTLEKALDRNLRKVKHNHTLPLLDLSSGEVVDVPTRFRENPHSKALEVFPTGLANVTTD